MRQGDVLQLRYPPKASDSYYTYERVVQAGGVELTPQKRTLPDAVDGGSAGNENRGMPTTSATEANGQQDIFKGCVVCFTSTMHTKSLKTKLQVRRLHFLYVSFRPICRPGGLQGHIIPHNHGTQASLYLFTVLFGVVGA